MTFEEVLPGLKAKKNMYTGWGGAEKLCPALDTIEQNGVARSDTLFLHQCFRPRGGASWSPTPVMCWRQIGWEE